MFCLWMLSCQIFFILDQLKILQVICVWERKIKYMYKSEMRYMCRIIYRIQQVRIPSFTDWFVYSCVSFCHRTFIKLLFYSLKHTKKNNPTFGYIMHWFDLCNYNEVKRRAFNYWCIPLHLIFSKLQPTHQN